MAVTPPIISTGTLNRQPLANQAAVVTGAVKDLPIEDWDRSYRVNLRGPVLLAHSNLKDQNVLSKQILITNGWIEAVDRLSALLSGEAD